MTTMARARPVRAPPTLEAAREAQAQHEAARAACLALGLEEARAIAIIAIIAILDIPIAMIAMIAIIAIIAIIDSYNKVFQWLGPRRPESWIGSWVGLNLTAVTAALTVMIISMPTTARVSWYR